MHSPRKRRKRRSAPCSWSEAVVLLLCCILLLLGNAYASVDPYSGLAEEEDLPPLPPPPRRKAKENFEDDLDTLSSSFSSSETKLRKGGNGPSRIARDDTTNYNTGSVSSSSESLFIHIVPHSHVDHGWQRSTDAYEETVQEILASATQQLDLDVRRKFVWSETWYFRRWFESLGISKREKIKRLVKEGRFEFVGGGLVMHDETLSSQRLIMEQIAEGHMFLEQAFGISSPKIAWQIDSAGHSDATPGILSRLGYSVAVLNRVHFRTKQRFRKGQHLEFVWRGSKMGSSDALRSSASKDAKTLERENADEVHQIFAHLLPASYASPEGNDFEKAGTRQVTAPRGRAVKLLQYAREISKAFRTHHVMIPWGDDFRFREADKQFGNMDKIIAEIAAENPTVRIQYSTATEYFEAVQRAAASSSLRFPLYIGDFLPYADSGDAYWTGMYSSRPSIKRWARQLEGRVFWAGTLFSLARAKAGLYGNLPRVASIEMETGRVVPDDSRAAPSWGIGLHRSLIFAKRQAALIGTHHHAITGNARDQVIKDFLKRAKSGYESASRVAMESLSFLLAKRKLDFKSAGPHVRPPLKPWSSTDSLELKDDGRQWPIIFTNDAGQWRKEVVAVRLACPWATAKRAKVVDGATGSAIPSQVHKSLASSNSGDEGGWKTDTFLFIYVEVPPLGFTTYFVSSSTSSERLASASQPVSSAVVQVHVFDLLNGRVVPFVATSTMEATEGVKVMATTPANSPESRSNTAGACLLIDNDILVVEMDCDSSLIRAVVDKRTKKRVILRQEFRVHESSRGGVNLFRPDRLESSPLQTGVRGRLTVAIVRGPLVQEVHLLADGVSQVVRLIRAPHGLDSQTSISLEGHVFVSYAVAGTSPDVDTVVRYTTDLKTSGAFFTDNPSGALTERKAQTDAPLAANFFPCSSSIMLKSTSLVFGVITNQPIGCSGAANIASGGGEFGVIELMLHRTPTADDGRGLGEGLPDFGVSRLDTMLFFDQPEAAIARRPNLISRLAGLSEIVAAQLDYSALLSPFLNREVWSSRFLCTSSMLKRNGLPLGTRFVSMFPRDEMSDEVLVRVEYTGESLLKLDWADLFNNEEVVIGGIREVSKQPSLGANSLSFQCSERPDDFHGAGLDSDVGSSSSGYILSEHAIREISGENDDIPLLGRLQMNSARKLVNNANSGKADSNSLLAGGVQPSAPLLDDKWTSYSLPQELRKGDSRLFSLVLLALPDERLPKRPMTTSSSSSSTGAERSNLESKRKSSQQGQDVSKVTATLTRPPSSPPSASIPQTSGPGSTTNNQKGRKPQMTGLGVNDIVSGIAKPTTSFDHSTSTVTRDETFSSSTAGGSLRNGQDHRGKSLASLKVELIAEERRSAALEIRSKRLQQNVDELLQELEIFSDIDDGLDKKTALEELTRAEEQLVEGNLLLAESKEKVLALQRELDHVEALDEIRHGPRKGVRVHSGDNSATLHGIFAGAGGMLVIMIAVQWFLTGRRRHQQAYVPVRYVPVNHSGASFALPVKRL